MRLAILMLAAGLAAGCGGDTVRVSGRIVQNGQPYTANLSGDTPDTFAIDLVGNGFIFSATPAGDGTFTVPGSAKSGVPRGTYKITVLHSGFMGEGGDRFKARYALEKTPLSVELTKSADLVIDVGTGMVTGGG